MSRLVVYVSSRPCPDMTRWRRWRAGHDVTAIERRVDDDPAAKADLLRLVGHESVPTLVIAGDGSPDPVAPPRALDGRSPRAFDRGTVLSEPNPGQIIPFLQRHGIDVTTRAGTDPGPGA